MARYKYIDTTPWFLPVDLFDLFLRRPLSERRDWGHGLSAHACF